MFGVAVLLVGLALVGGGVSLVWRRRAVLLDWARQRNSNRLPWPIGPICIATGLAGVVVIAGIVLIAKGM
jgi:hypothetical protein